MIMDEEGKEISMPSGMNIVYRESRKEDLDKILISYFTEKGEINHKYIKRHPIPEKEYWFESVWEQNRNKEIF